MARQEIERAKSLDAQDATAWLYAALLDQQENRINEGVRDLERSRELNDNRSLFRSQLLLDQDRAVRSANLANGYADAGMNEVSVREAARSVNADYADFSGHLFLANSYSRRQDPGRISLRYETAAVSEYLLANLLAPVGAGALSPTISQQEYNSGPVTTSPSGMTGHQEEWTCTFDRWHPTTRSQRGDRPERNRHKGLRATTASDGTVSSTGSCLTPGPRTRV